MENMIPYLVSPGSISRCLEKIKNAATPEKVTGDFINTKLGIKGGTGKALVPFLKKIGFVQSDGTPSDLYVRFRNPTGSGMAIADAMKFGYNALYEINEYAHDLNDNELSGLIVQVTGLEKQSKVVSLIEKTYKNLKNEASFEPSLDTENINNLSNIPNNNQQALSQQSLKYKNNKVGMNLSYTINLNLPATSNIAVFNAIFKSLKENLLDTDEAE